LFRRIGQFFKDITETIKRERGKLQINSDQVEFTFKTGSLKSQDSDIKIKGSTSLQEMFVPVDIQDDSPIVNIKGESDHSRSPGVSSLTTSFRILVQKMNEIKPEEQIKGNACEFDQSLTLKDLQVEDFQEAGSVKDFFGSNQIMETSIKKASNVDVFQFSVHRKDFLLEKTNIKKGDMRTSTVLKDLETEFDSEQREAFHFENALIINALIDEYSPFFDIKCYHSLGCVMRYPIKRIRVSKSGYEKEELKRALSFIVKRYKSFSQLSIVGIYKNVPIDTVERLTFSKDRDLFFYLKRETFKRSILMDVLVVKTKEGKYHVGPIVRKA